jgi:rubrerythrin
MSKSLDDLKAGFAGESQANQRYLNFATQADRDGYPQVAKLFRAAAASERVHAGNHMRAAGDIKTTAENLEVAIAGEHYEVVTMYPEFIKDAMQEENRKANTSFNWAWEVEKVHEALYTKAKENLGKEEESFDYYVCPVCGFTHERNAPDKCPVCGTPGARFQRIE